MRTSWRISGVVGQVDCYLHDRSPNRRGVSINARVAFEVSLSMYAVNKLLGLLGNSCTTSFLSGKVLRTILGAHFTCERVSISSATGIIQLSRVRSGTTIRPPSVHSSITAFATCTLPNISGSKSNRSILESAMNGVVLE